MNTTKHERGENRRSFPGSDKLRRAINYGILKFSAALAVVNSVFLLLTAVTDFERMPDAMLLPVCSVLLIVALIFLRNAVLLYADELFAGERSLAEERRNRAENVSNLPEKTFFLLEYSKIARIS